MKNRLPQIEKSFGAERFPVLRQMIFVYKFLFILLSAWPV